MGAHMVRNLVRAGHDVTVWNRTASKAYELARELGCDFTEGLVELATGRDAVITMLADDAASHAVHFAPDGLFAGLGTPLFIEMGTMSPDHIAELAQGAPEGTTLIDAPVSGATQAASDAQLLIMAGCDPSTVAAAMPLFDAMGKQTICLGRTGAGSIMKLAVNSLIHGINQTLSEALALTDASGITTDAAFDVIEASAACAPMLKYRRALYLDEAANAVTFTVALARKDMEVTAALAEQLGTALPQGEVTLEKLKQAEAEGFGPRDMAAMRAFMKGKET